MRSSETVSSRRLRMQNISHTIELEDLNNRVMDKLCDRLTRKDSLTGFLCEYAKISENPGKFTVERRYFL